MLTRSSSPPPLHTIHPYTTHPVSGRHHPPSHVTPKPVNTNHIQYTQPMVSRPHMSLPCQPVQDRSSHVTHQADTHPIPALSVYGRQMQTVMRVHRGAPVPQPSGETYRLRWCDDHVYGQPTTGAPTTNAYMGERYAQSCGCTTVHLIAGARRVLPPVAVR